MTIRDNITWCVKKGDLVEFTTNFISWMHDYKHRNPGVVLDVERRISHVGNMTSSATVLWADGSVTSEHSGYLMPRSSS